MKAVVVEIKGKMAVVMSQKGEFIKLRNNGSFRVGGEVEVPPAVGRSARLLKRIASIAAVFLFVSLSGLGVYMYHIPYSYINIDINPSIEITTNIYDRIIKVAGLNSDGEKLLASNNLGSLQNKKIEEGIDGILNSIEKERYFEDDAKNAVVFTVSSKSDKKAESLESDVENIAAREIKSKNAGTEVLVGKVDIKKHEDAKKAGISPGKLMLIEKLIKEKPELKVEDLKDKPVKEILNSIKAGRSAGKEEKDQNKGEDRPGQNTNEKSSVKEGQKIKSTEKTGNKTTKNVKAAEQKTGKKEDVKKQENKKESGNGNKRTDKERNADDKAGDSGKNNRQDKESGGKKDDKSKNPVKNKKP
ncbi:MAG: anti-sigma factor domain-containing protein [Clostridiales bacterium]|jgi:hypothetical protein|nr:anti-sigma factor domain-containing protein [Eubacteriales bacterium]MDH7566267.1 anti-sigma factor domain-containing protein [Clostridiales bacterium]